MKELYIIGAGGFGREVAWLVERINEKQNEWDFQGFIDDNQDLWKTTFDGYTVIGGCDYFASIDHEIWVVCAVGASKTRRRIIEKVKQNKFIHFPVLVDPSVIKSNRVEIGEGSILCAGIIMTVDVTIGRHCIINLDCTIGHDAILKDYVTLYPSVNVSGASIVGTETEIGTGAQIIQGITVGNNTIIGAGAVIVKDLPIGCTAVGVPAKPIKNDTNR